MNAIRSSLVGAFFTLFSSALILTLGASTQSSGETLLTLDNAYNPIPSPDGRYIAYVRTGWGEGLWSGFGRGSLVSDVKIMNAGGVPTPRTLAKDYFLSGWTPDSKEVACFRDWRYELVSTEGKKITEGRIPFDPNNYFSSEWVAYSPSLATLLWSRPVDSLHRVIETSDRTVLKEEVFWGERVVPSPDGRYLAAFRESPQTALRVYDFRNERWADLGSINIHPDKDWWYIQPNWNPWFADSSRLVFLSDSTLVISAPDGTNRSEIEIAGPAGLPVPSPDGQSVAYVIFEPRPGNTRPDLLFWGGTTIKLVSVSPGSSPRAVTLKNQDEVYDLKWLNNHTLVFDRVADAIFYKQARIWKATVSH